MSLRHSTLNSQNLSPGLTLKCDDCDDQTEEEVKQKSDSDKAL